MSDLVSPEHLAALHADYEAWEAKVAAKAERVRLLEQVAEAARVYVRLREIALELSDSDSHAIAESAFDALSRTLAALDSETT